MYRLIYEPYNHYFCYFNKITNILNNPEIVIISSENKFELFKLCGSFIKDQVSKFLIAYPNGSMYEWQDHAAKICFDILQHPNLSLEDYIKTYIEFDKFGDCEADNFFIYEGEDLLYHKFNTLKTFSNIMSYYDSDKVIEMTLEKVLSMIGSMCFE